MRTSSLELNVYGLKSRSGTEIDMLFVKTETNPSPIGKVFCYIQVYLYKLFESEQNKTAKNNISPGTFTFFHINL